MTSKVRYTRTYNGAIGRIINNGETEWVTYIRFCGDRAEAIIWGTSADAAHGWDDRAFRAVQNFNRRRQPAVVGRSGYRA
jgi:hypothetical protein